jgi:hypothetical protein
MRARAFDSFAPGGEQRFIEQRGGDLEHGTGARKK